MRVIRTVSLELFKRGGTGHSFGLNRLLEKHLHPVAASILSLIRVLVLRVLVNPVLVQVALLLVHVMLRLQMLFVALSLFIDLHDIRVVQAGVFGNVSLLISLDEVHEPFQVIVELGEVVDFVTKAKFAQYIFHSNLNYYKRLLINLDQRGVYEVAVNSNLSGEQL